MAVLDHDGFLAQIKARVGDDTSETALQFIGDMTDTFTDLETKATGGGENYKEKYETLAQQYKDRFFSSNPPPKPKPKETDNSENITFADLFKKREG